MRVRALLVPVFLFLLSPNLLRADLPLPLPAGADAPNFTLTDLDGVTHTLYDYLDDGKTVMIDFSATWCGPCWNYHNTHILSDLYNTYGPNGTDEVMVFFIEADPGTPVSSLYGGSGSQGNWVAGTPYPIMDDGTGLVSNSFQITYYPTLYAICPNRKTYVVGQAPLSGWVNWINSCSLDATALVEDASCYGENDGSVDQTATGGTGNLFYQWSNGSNTQDISNLAPGTYTCTITEGQGHKIESGPYTIISPPELVIAASTVANVGCFGEATGAVSVTAGGGNPGYSYLWDNGVSGPSLINVPAGNYSVLVTDNNGCNTVEPFVVQQPTPLVSSAIVNDENCGNSDGTIILQPQGGTFPYTYDFGNGPTGSPIAIDLAAGTYPVSIEDMNGCNFNMTIIVEEDPPPFADAGPTSQMDCIVTEITLDGTASESGTGIEYLWSTTDGMIISGDDTTQPVVGAAGTYNLEVIDQISGCIGTSTVIVTEDVAVPVSDAGLEGAIDCTIITADLDGSASSQGSNYVYEWMTTDGNIVSGADELMAVADAAGTYSLEVTNTLNGCSSTSEVLVVDNHNEPVADAGPSAELNCTVSDLMLDGSGSESGPSIIYSWSTVDGHIIAGADTQTPTVKSQGTYEIEVIDITTGCSSVSSVEVFENVAIPLAEAIGEGTIDCNNPDIQLDGSASESGSNIEYLWSTTDGNIISGEDSTTPVVDAPGTYTLEVFNTENGCFSSTEVLVDEILPVEASIDVQTNLLCAGDTDGSATVAADLGTLPYTYEWSTGGEEATETDLAAGFYTVSVSDADNCLVIVDIEITSPQELLANASATNETSAGADDGTATANPEGGTGTYSYLWSNGEITASISGLAPGSYDVEITDENGCLTMETVTVGEFNCTISATAEGNEVSCNGGSDGMAQLDLSNAADPIQIEWSSGGTEAIETGLAAGTYTVNIIDGNNCPTTAMVEILEPSSVLLELQNSSAVSCFGGSDGSAKVKASGGVGGYEYEWPSGNTSSLETDLAAGTYLVSLTDQNGCQTELAVEVSQPDELLSDFVIVGESSNEAGDGSIELDPTGGTGPYDFFWDTGETDSILNDLSVGSYSVEITDANGCTFEETYTIDPFDCSFIEVISLSESTSCYNGGDGLAMVDIEGGVGPYTYEWFDGSTGNSVAGLPAGEYVVIVTDANNCPVEGVAIIEEPEELQLQVTDQTNIECPGQVSGSAEVAGSGGTPGYEYQWADGQTGAVAADLPEGSINVQVTDLNGCQDVISVLILEAEDNTPPTIIALDMITVNLNNAGEASLNPSMVDMGSFDNCGVPIMSLNEENFDCSNIGLNEVEYTGIDNSGNSSSTIIIVEVVDAIPPSLECPMNIISTYCNEPVFFEPFATDNCDVSVEMTAGLESGSIFPEGETGITFEAVDPSGNTNNCTFTVTIENTLSAFVEASGTCEGEMNGTAFAEAEGGLPGYTYSWDTGDSGPSISDLPAGEYGVVITDAAGCITEETITVDEFELPIYTIVDVQNEDNSNGNGAIDVTVEDGTEPYIYIWTDVEGNVVGDTEDIDGLSSGSYFLEIIDANGCSTFSEPIIIENQVGTVIVLSNSALDVFPNPATDECQVQLTLSENMPANMQLFDLTGRLIRQESSEATGLHEWRIELNGLSAGLYLVRIQVEGQSISKKLIVE